jgi:hypothetical protein
MFVFNLLAPSRKPDFEYQTENQRLEERDFYPFPACADKR